MITNTGKNIIAKYLIGQAPAYASYLAFGCGAKPLTSLQTPGDYQNKQSLDFEMFRVPITSRGYVTEDNVPYIVMTAELPTEERYEITEIGVFSAGANPSATMNDSRTIISFAENEIWEYHTETSSNGLQSRVETLNGSGDNIISVKDENNVELQAFQTNANNPTFSNVGRLTRKERPRFLNNTILMSGSSSDLRSTAAVSGIVGTGTKVTYTTAINHGLSVGDTVTITGTNPSNYSLSGVKVTEVAALNTFAIASTEVGSYVSGGSVALPKPVIYSGNHIHLTSAGVNFSKNSPLDELKLAFSVMNKDGAQTYSPDRVSIIVEFSTKDFVIGAEYAKFEVSLAQGTSAGQHDFESNRYVVVSKKLGELTKTSGFNWADVEIIKIYACVIDGGSPSANYYVSLDAMRLENVTTVNPLYGLTGYSVVQTTAGDPILKDLNTSNLAEFRFGLDLGIA